jgi:Tol biopolymer transport system component
MTQPPPGTGRPYPPEPPYPDRRLPPPAPVTPSYRVPQGVRSPYLPGQEPLPPRRTRRSSPLLAPTLAFIGLILVGGASLWAMGIVDATIGDATADPALAAASADPGATQPPEGEGQPAEPAPLVTAPPIVEPPSSERADVRGTILFTRSGDIWAASGTSLERLTANVSVRADVDATWSPDGKSIYFIRTSKRTTNKTRPGGKYTLYPTDLMRMKPDGSSRKKVYDALIKDSRGLWFSLVRQPSVSPSGKDVVVVSDGPDGSAEEVTLHLVNSRTGQLRRVAAPAEPGLGHNDPAFSPDGTKIAFTHNSSGDTDGQPRIGIHTCQTKSNCSLGKVRYLKSGYAHPAWSPDGELLAVEATNGRGRDIVILNARRGDVRVQLTTDGDSFAPVFSPAGDQIAYLHRDGLNIDLRVMTLEFDDLGRITKVDDRPVTSDGGIDGASTPSWFIPPAELPDAVGPATASAGAGEPAAVSETDQPADAAADGAPPPPPGS